MPSPTLGGTPTDRGILAPTAAVFVPLVLLRRSGGARGPASDGRRSAADLVARVLVLGVLGGPLFLVTLNVAVERAGADVDWAALAYELGYSDQAHLVRDFTATIGISPTAYARSLSGGQADSAPVPPCSYGR